MTDNYLSWVHFGDLHIRNAEDENYLDFLDLIQEANQHLAGKVDFAFLPGDNADDALESQYKLVRDALADLAIPVQIITGDHDRKAGTLELFRKHLEPVVYRAVTIRNFRLLFLNAMDSANPKDFDFGPEQMEWLQGQPAEAQSSGLRPLVFTHLYPSELRTQANAFSRLIAQFGVEAVEMGHTHYNELANDGRTIYAVTRSTGQIEEGPPGFSVTVINKDVISWKFKPRGEWPFVMITSPADEKLITKPASPRHIVRGTALIQAKIWSSLPIRVVNCSIDDAPPQRMHIAGNVWELPWNSESVADGIHHLRVEATTETGLEASDEISVLVSQNGQYTPPLRRSIDYENAIGSYTAKHILGTQLGPNENGTKGPWPSWRG